MDIFFGGLSAVSNCYQYIYYCRIVFTKKKMKESTAISFNQKNVYCAKSQNGYGMAYFTKHNFNAGDIIMHGFGKIINHQTKHNSVQIGPNKYFLPTKWTGRYWNHSCCPNCFVNTRTDGFPDMVALRNIKKGEEITYSYFMTEYEWSPVAVEKKIPCLCGTKKCCKKIMAFSQLSEKQKNNLKKRNLISSYLHNF
jgi:hypothetical protein